MNFSHAILAAGGFGRMRARFEETLCQNSKSFRHKTNIFMDLVSSPGCVARWLLKLALRTAVDTHL